MHSLQNLIAGLLLFSTAVYALASPEQAAIGKVRGWTGAPERTPTGDYLTAVFCYCEYPQKTEEAMGPAHFYQFEYYNKHHDITFILVSACPDGDTGFDRLCVPPYLDINGAFTGNTMEMNCKLWDGYETVGDKIIHRTDSLCYMPHHKHGVDYLMFNEQRRNLGWRGGQRPVAADLEPGTCETLCHENMDMPVLQGESFPPSHQVEWTELDDMCDGCQ